jgi:glycosyltransferase involved in cell wall biosynthesis
VTAFRRPVIALVTDAIYPYHCGGKEQRYHELVSRLSERGDVHVYTMNWWGGSRTRRTENAVYHAVCRHHPLYSGGRRSMREAVFFALGCLRLLGCRFDVLEADHMPYLQILVLRMVATIRRKRFVVTWHEVWGQQYWEQYLGRTGLIAWLLEWLAMRVPDHIVAASPQTAERLRAAMGSRASISVAPNGIDMDAIGCIQPAGDPVDVVVVGRLIEHKRVDMLLAALAILHSAGEPVTCRVIGDGPARTSLEAMAQRLGLAGSVEFLDDIREQKQLYGLMKSARIGAFPSAREGFGIAVLEAIACGLPVVTTSAPDNLARFLVARSVRGTVCDSSATALASALRDSLAQRGTADEPEPWLAEFGWDATAAAVAGALLP